MNEGLIERYQRDGYVVMEDLVSHSEVTELREEAEKLCLEKGAALARGSDATSSEALAAYLALTSCRAGFAKPSRTRGSSTR